MKFSKFMLLGVATASAAFVFTGCSTDLSPEPFDANLRLTAGQVKMNVKRGETTQLELFKALGAPNVVALDSEKGEIWTYDQIKVRRTAQGYNAGAFFATAFAFGDQLSTSNIGRGGGAGGVEVDGSVGTLTTSVLTATLIVRFDANEKVESYKMLVTSF